jgi:hypothetical protein
MHSGRPSLLAQVPDVRRPRLDIRKHDRVGEVSILKPDDRIELIEGEIVDMVPTGSPLGGAVIALNDHLTRLAGDAATGSVQGPLRLSDSNEPQPVLTLRKPRN